MGVLGRALPWILHIAIYKLAIDVLITVIPGLPPHMTFESYSVVPPRSLDRFNRTYLLDEAEIFYNGEINGPESVAVRGDVVYTGDAAGNLIKILPDGKHSIVTRFQHPCGPGEESKCGWPLGMKFDSTEKLIIADMYGGIVKLDVDTGIWEYLVVNRQAGIDDGVVPRAPNDLDVAKDGTVYWSDVSKYYDKFGYLLHEIYGEPSGRLIKYDPKLMTNIVLLSRIHFANGVCLSKNEDFVLVSEIVQARILRYYLKGPKAGTHDIFINGLPGIPDNIRPNGKGGFYASIAIPWNDEFSLFSVEWLGKLPYLRKFIVRFRLIALKVLAGIKTILPENVYIQSAETYMSHFPPLLDLTDLPKVGMVLELSEDGKVTNILRSKEGEVYTVSQFTLGDKYAYLTSPYNTKVWRINAKLLPE